MSRRARTRRPAVAIAHDYLTQRGGAERVVLSLLKAFPGAAVHTTFYDPETTFPELREARIVTSPLNRHAVLRNDPRRALPLLRHAASRLQVDADVVIASTSGWAHGFDITGRRLVYCHSPAHWLHQTHEYLGGPPWTLPAGWALGALRPGLRRWDLDAARRADRYLCNSRAVRDRICAEYDIEADVVSPASNLTATGSLQAVPGAADWSDGFLLVVARLVPYKHVREVMEAVRDTDHRLLVVGGGPQRHALERIRPDNVRIFDQLPDDQLRWAYAHASALVAASFEDFGLTPVEAAAFGKPSIALRSGGYLDTVIEATTGLFFDTLDPEAIRAALDEHRNRRWNPQLIRAHSARFGECRFVERMRREVAGLADPADDCDQQYAG